MGTQSAPRRVLYAVGGLGVGGIETWLYQLLSNLDRRSVEAEVAVLSDQVGEYERRIAAMGFVIRRSAPPRRFVRMIRDLRRLMRDGRYDAVHVCLHFFSGVIVREAYLAKIPIRIVHSRTMSDARKRSMTRTIYERIMRLAIARYSTHRLAVSPEAGELLFGSSPSRFLVVPSALDLSLFQGRVEPAEVRRRFGLSEGEIVIGHVGRMAPAKNHRLIIEIARAYTVREPRARFVLVGDGSLRGKVEAKIREYGLQEKVILVGFQPDISKIMRGLFDVFLFPSIWEGSPRVVVEAQASGLPSVISTSISSHMDLVPSLIKRVPLDSGLDEWLNALDWAIDMRRRVDKESAYQMVAESDFSIERQAERLIRLYRGLPY